MNSSYEALMQHTSALQSFVWDYVILAVIVGVIGIVCVTVIFCVTFSKAEKIAKEIAKEHAHKVEDRILHEIDTGEFFY